MWTYQYQFDAMTEAELSASVLKIEAEIEKCTQKVREYESRTSNDGHSLWREWLGYQQNQQLMLSWAKRSLATRSI